MCFWHQQEVGLSVVKHFTKYEDGVTLRNRVSLIFSCQVESCSVLRKTSGRTLAIMKLLVASTSDLRDVINCQFRKFAAAPLEQHAFSVARPRVWNSLHDHLRDPPVVPGKI